MIVIFQAELGDQAFDENFEMISSTYDEVVLTAEYMRTCWHLQGAGEIFAKKVSDLQNVKNRTVSENNKLQEYLTRMDACRAFRSGKVSVSIKRYSNRYFAMVLPQGFDSVKDFRDLCQKMAIPENLKAHLDVIDKSLIQQEKKPEVKPEPKKPEQKQKDKPKNESKQQVVVADVDDLVQATETIEKKSKKR